MGYCNRVQPSKWNQTENDRVQNKKWCKLARGVRQKKGGVKQTGVKQGRGKFIYHLFNDAVISSDYIAL